MTAPDDGSRDDPPNGTPDGQADPDVPFDEETAWRLIVENYGERPDLGDRTAGPPTAPVAEPLDPPLFDQSYLDSLDAGRGDDSRADGRHDEEHFVPPEPPPVPKGPPARRLAWLGLFGPPLLMLAAVIFSWAFPTWFAMALVASFVGGFVFLVATMPRGGGDGWDDGAVL